MKTLALPAPAIAGLQDNWVFTPSPVRWWVRFKHSPLFHARPAPAHAIVRLPTSRQRWVALFLYAPDATLDEAQVYTLERLRDLDLPILCVVSSRQPSRIPDNLPAYCDALIWKGLEGYDFSAYALALHVLAQHSPDANVLLMNDSTFGPFSDFRGLLDAPPWALTGFTASSLGENHLQSYALVFRQWNQQSLQGVRNVLKPDRCFNDFDPVVTNQEQRLAACAARHGTVGALWFGDGSRVDDPMLRFPRELVKAGLPFLKKSLLGKNRMFNQVEACREILQSHGHPTPSEGLSYVPQ
jgi:lipopolysaccharide biosynthesis protein